MTTDNHENPAPARQVPPATATPVGGVPQISIVICTYNRAGILAKCLESVLAQTLPQSGFELIVIDNNSTDDTRATCDAFGARFANFSCILEPRQGLARARNTGWRAARTPLVAYLDDDELAHADWAEQLLRTARNEPEAAVIGGELEPLFTCERPEWLTDPLLHYYSCHLNWSETPRFLQGTEWLIEGNCLYRREILAAHGGFPEELGRKGALLLSGEGAINDVLAAHGARSFFTPAARVRHLIDPGRVNTAWLARRSLWGGMSRALVDDYLQDRTGLARPWRDLRLPAGVRDWEHLVNMMTDGNLDESLRKLHDLGYLLVRTGLIEPQHL